MTIPQTRAELIARIKELEERIDHRPVGVRLIDNPDVVEYNALYSELRNTQPWTRFVDCCGAVAFFVEGGERDATALLERWLGARIDETCSRCGSWSYDIDDAYDVTPPETPEESTTVLTRDDVAARVATGRHDAVTGLDHNHPFAFLQPSGDCSACDALWADERACRAAVLDQLDRLGDPSNAIVPPDAGFYRALAALVRTH